MNTAKKETQTITVVLKDVCNRTILFYEDFQSARGPFQVAQAAAHNFFDRHFQTFAAASPPLKSEFRTSHESCGHDI